MKTIPFALTTLAVCLASVTSVDVQAVEPTSSTAGDTSAADDQPTETIDVIGERGNRISKGATGLTLSLQETPQSVTELNSEWLDAFHFDNINAALQFTTGVNVEEVETDRTYYNSRGFDIKSMQVDGIGLPFNWNVVGALDTAIYERVEVIRGANGLLTGTGNPSGTVNFVRKRPLSEFAAEMEASIDSWHALRVEADVSTPLTDNASWAGRAILVKQEGETHLDRYENDRSVFYAVVDGQINDNMILTFGYTQQDNKSDGVLWGALPMLYVDGEQTDFDPEDSTSMNWTFWNTFNKTGFVELEYALPNEWRLKSVLTYNDYHEESELFYTYTMAGLEHDGTGLLGWPGKFESSSVRQLWDTMVSGQFALAGRDHDLLIGVSLSQAESDYFEHAVPSSDPAWGPLPAFPGWDGDEVARPDYGPAVKASDWQDDINRIYIVSRFNVSDDLKVIVGSNTINVKSDGYSFDEMMNRDEQKTSPYIGAIYSFNRDFNAYFSYSDIYEPQTEMDEQGKRLPAAKGYSYEAGLKLVSFDNHLLTSLAIFRAEQDDYAEYAGFNQDTGLSYYNGLDVDSQGYELEASGRISDEWLLQVGYTWMKLTNAQTNDDARTFIPRQTFKLMSRYRPASLSALEIGGTLRWQDDIYITTGLGEIRQKAYSALSLYASYELSKHWEMSVNLNNVTDKKYLTSLYWDQSFYAAGRNWSLTVESRF